jgi:hypothetical protein
MSDGKFCTKCKHYSLSRSSPAGSQHRCTRPIVDLVTGESKPHDAICATERMGVATTPIGICGADGQFWESR